MMARPAGEEHEDDGEETVPEEACLQRFSLRMVLLLSSRPEMTKSSCEAKGACRGAPHRPSTTRGGSGMARLSEVGVAARSPLREGQLNLGMAGGVGVPAGSRKKVGS